MTFYDKAIAAFAGSALVIAGATAAYASPRCPDQQISESGPFQGRICQYGDWQVSHHHGDWRGLFDRPHFK